MVESGQLPLKLLQQPASCREGRPGPQPVHAARASYCPAATTVLRPRNPPSSGGQVKLACTLDYRTLKQDAQLLCIISPTCFGMV